MKKTLNLYERIPKSIENPRGVRVIEENENFIEQRPMLLCISAQDDTKSVFGITKFGMNAVGMRIRENNRTGFDLNGFPASFCAIRLEYVENDSEEHSEDNKESFFETFYDKYLKLLEVMADAVGYKDISRDEIKQAYSPKGLMDKITEESVLRRAQIQQMTHDYTQDRVNPMTAQEMGMQFVLKALDSPNGMDTIAKLIEIGEKSNKKK